MTDIASMAEPAARAGRGGSAARRALRKSGPKSGAVRPGMPGGTYRPLSEHDMQRIHTTALDVLEKLGVGEPIQEILDVALPRLLLQLVPTALLAIALAIPRLPQFSLAKPAAPENESPTPASCP